MHVTIETNGEAVVFAVALFAYTKESLDRSGYLHQQTNEPPYYTEQRELMRALEKFINKRT